MDIKTLRIELGVTKDEVSKKTGIPRTKIAKWEIGIGYPKPADELKHLNYDETTEAAGMNIAALHANHKSLEMGKVYAVGEMKRKINALKVVSNPFVKPKEKATQ